MQVLVAVALVPLIGIGVVGLISLRRGLEVVERSLEVAVLERADGALGARLDGARAATLRIAQLLGEATLPGEARLALVRDTFDSAPSLARITFHGLDGVPFDALHRAGVALPPEPQLEEQERTSPGGWVATPGAFASLRLVLPIGPPQAPTGWVSARLDGLALEAELAEVGRSLLELDPGGLVLIEPGGGVLAGGGDFPAGASLAGRDLLGALSVPAAAYTRPFAASAEYVDGAGRERVGTLRTRPGEGLALLARRHAAQAYGVLAQARWLLATAAGAGVLLALVAAALLAARITRPVDALVQLAGAYGARRLAERSSVKSGDELELLGQAMERMADGIVTGEAEVARRKLNERELSRFLPAQVAQEIVEGRRTVELGGTRRQVSVLFADVVAFTPFAEGSPPEQTVALLNELFAVLSEVVFRHEGTVDKFIGDCVMALFGAPDAQSDHAARALAAAEDMHRFVEAEAPRWKATYGVEVKLGIGIHSGEALVGHLGSTQRLEYTAIGDVVNVAARLEALARPGQTLLTETTAAAAGPAFATRDLGSHPLRGKQNAVAVKELL